jgi:hypothetical protein
MAAMRGQTKKMGKETAMASWGEIPCFSAPYLLRYSTAGSPSFRKLSMQPPGSYLEVAGYSTAGSPSFRKLSMQPPGSYLQVAGFISVPANQ